MKITSILSLLPFCYGFINPYGRNSVSTISRHYTSMNMFDRFFRVVSSNVNSVLKGLEDPEKVLDQAVNDMQNDLIKIRQSYAEISATQKRMTNQKQQADNVATVRYRICMLIRY